MKAQSFCCKIKSTGPGRLVLKVFVRLIIVSCSSMELRCTMKSCPFVARSKHNKVLFFRCNIQARGSAYLLLQYRIWSFRTFFPFFTPKTPSPALIGSVYFSLVLMLRFDLGPLLPPSSAQPLPSPAPQRAPPYSVAVSAATLPQTCFTSTVLVRFFSLFSPLTDV